MKGNLRTGFFQGFWDGSEKRWLGHKGFGFSAQGLGLAWPQHARDMNQCSTAVRAVS